MACTWAARRDGWQPRWGQKQQARGVGLQAAGRRVPGTAGHVASPSLWRPKAGARQRSPPKVGERCRETGNVEHSQPASPPPCRHPLLPGSRVGLHIFWKNSLSMYPGRRKTESKKKTTASRSHRTNRTNPGEQWKEIPVAQLCSWPNEKLAPIRTRNQKSLWRTTSKKTAFPSPLRKTLGR